MYKSFKNALRHVTDYYELLVEETKAKRQVGSTNEWVLDNYYMLSEQEKVLRVELRSKTLRNLPRQRTELLVSLLSGFLERTYYQLDKNFLFRFLSTRQAREKDYLSYDEVGLLLTLLKYQLVLKLADLCDHLYASGSYKSAVGDVGALAPDQVDQVAKDNLLMMNLFNSLKKATKIEMSEVYDRVSFSERALRGEKAGMYDQMYDANKADYRAQIVRKARRKRQDEYKYVLQLVEEADKRGEHVGWQLFPPKAWKRRAYIYVCVVVGMSLLLAVFFATLAMGCYRSNFEGPTSVGWWVVLGVCALLMVVPFSQIVIDLFNNLLYRIHKPRGTFKLKFKDGIIPDEYATMVIVPTILKDAAKTRQMLNQLEVYYLSNGAVENLTFALLGDAAAISSEETPYDQEVVDAGLEKVRELNEKYGRPIFHFVYRRRAYSQGEQCWLGFERKRGAILHFNDLLLGRLSDEEKQRYFRCETISDYLRSCDPTGAGYRCPVQFVITLDTDTELVLYSAQKLIGAMAHPLNRAVLSADKRRVASGYGIMQPRVNVDVEVTNKSRYAQLFSGLGGLDVYTTASFELYQDIFDEGSFCGKGIYDLRIFQQVLRGTFPQNLILSHDLLEGCHLRCGLINDVELFDDSPSNYLDDAKRHHRWTRGDWQITPWLWNHVRNEAGEKTVNQVNAIGRWKILDNLRRSLLSLALLLSIFFGFAFGNINPVWFLLVVFLVVCLPFVFFIIGRVRHLPRLGRQYRYYMTLLHGMAVVMYKTIVTFALIPKEAFLYTDAIVRSRYRMRISHRHLLAWVPSDEAARSTKGTCADYCAKFWPNFVCAAALIVVCALRLVSGGWNGSTVSTVWLLIAAAFTCLCWIVAPFLMHFLGSKFSKTTVHLNNDELTEVRKWAKDTWHFFDTLINEENNYLMPDNYQVNRASLCDYKTSPTNIGYSLTAIVSAAELGFVTHSDAVGRLAHVLDTVVQLPKWNGHLYNWYHIHTLKELPNYFISTADSGNFVACLYVVKGYLESLLDPYSDTRRVDLTVDDNAHAAAQLSRVMRLIDHTDFSCLYNAELGVFSVGFDTCSGQLLPYNYNNFASEARVTSYLSIAKGDVPYKHWFCLDKTLVQYRRYKGVASWYGTMFEYFMPLVFLRTYRHTLMDETYSFAIRAQREFIRNVLRGSHPTTDDGNMLQLPWGISETAYHELDDSQNYKYHAFGVPYLKFQNTTPDRIVISPYSSLLAMPVADRTVYDNMQRFMALGMYDEYGFYESYDAEDRECVRAHYAHHQGMILASLANYLVDGCLQRHFERDPQMVAKQTLLKEKVQVRPYIDLKVTEYKRYQYDKTPVEADNREYTTIANVPEVGILSNGTYTVMLDDRGAGFSRWGNVQLNRYRKVGSEYYGQFLYVRDLATDRLWCNTYAPLAVMPEHYRVVFASDRVKYYRSDGGIDTLTEITVAKDRNAELRRFTFANNTKRDVVLEITTYGEVILCPHQNDEAHRVFNGMTITSEYDAEADALIFTKPARENVKTTYYMIHKLFVDEADDTATASMPKTAIGGSALDAVQYETSRLRFLGRGNTTQHADVIETRQNLSGTVGTTLDPVMSMRRRLRIPAGDKAMAFLLVGFGKSREQLMAMVRDYHDAFSVSNAFEMATVFSNMRTSMSLLNGAEMNLYNSIFKYLMHVAVVGDAQGRIKAGNTLAQSGLWRFGISGDLAILLLELDSLDHASYAKEVLQAYEYYKVRGLHLDIVIVNDEQGDRRERLTRYIMDMANLEHLSVVKNPVGRVYVLNGTEISDAERTLLRTVARLTLTSAGGVSLEDQLANMERENQHYQDKEQFEPLHPISKARVGQMSRTAAELQFYNQYGGFSPDGTEYVVTNTNTPMPWVNVLSNPRFGCITGSTMSGFTFAYNAQQFKLTSWTNDIVRDAASEMLLIGHRQFVPSQARHGQGYSEFEAEYEGFQVSVRIFVASDAMAKYYQLRIVNKLAIPQTLAIDMAYKLVLGTTEEETARYLDSNWVAEDNALRVRNTYHETYSHATVLLTALQPIERCKIDYPNRKLIGFDLPLPASGTAEATFIVAVEDLHPQGSMQVVSASTLAQRDPNEAFSHVRQFWQRHLGTIEVSTPDRAFDIMVNHWYLYQVCSSRLFARAGFYQVGGATGFRDQLQDVMGILYTDPAYARRQILDHAAHQFAEGDVLHWWHESILLGSRTTFSDDYLWLVYVTYQYVQVTGDTTILDEVVSFCQADALNPGEAERGMRYTTGKHLGNLTEGCNADGGDTSFPPHSSIFDHLRLCITRALSRMGSHGLPLMGCGDWNDGMSAVGVHGRGESVWVAFFLVDLVPKFVELSRLVERTDEDFNANLMQQRETLIHNLQENAWDGAWFLRAYFDNGDPMGSRNNLECQIDLISQAWAILTDTATEDQKRSIFKECDTRLVNREHEIIQLLTPPFKHSRNNPGYICDYPIGVRENGGQYTHGAFWYIQALLKEGHYDEAYFNYSIINPIHRTSSLADVLKYKVEPYCIAADIYSNPQFPGRGGWTWYTGSASWAYKTAVENILGFHKQGSTVTLQPRIPSSWPNFTLRYRLSTTTTYTFIVGESATVLSEKTLDAVTVKVGTPIKLIDDGKEHVVLVLNDDK